MAKGSINEVVYFSFPPQLVYEVFMDQNLHSLFTESEVEFVAEVGAKFSLYGGYMTGRFVELIPNQSIVMDFKAQEEDWPEGHLSKVELHFLEDEKGTMMIFKHNGIPESLVEDFESGWKEYYWEPMADFMKSLPKKG